MIIRKKTKIIAACYTKVYVRIRSKSTSISILNICERKIYELEVEDMSFEFELTPT